jgi:hypothetical protein
VFIICPPHKECSLWREDLRMLMNQLRADIKKPGPAKKYFGNLRENGS